MSRRILRLALIPLLVAALLAPEVATMALAKTATSSPITTVSILAGKVVHGGTDIAVKYDCFPAGYGPYSTFGDVAVGQVSGALGSSLFRPVCNDRAQLQAVFVAGNFHVGDAAVNVLVCGFDCNSDSKEIVLHSRWQR